MKKILVGLAVAAMFAPLLVSAKAIPDGPGNWFHHNGLLCRFNFVNLTWKNCIWPA